MDATLTNFGQTHFGQADLGDARRTKRLVRVADRLAAHPAGSLPDKMQSPAELSALYHLVNNEQVTHASVMQTHFHRTRSAMLDHPSPVILLAHDDTDLNLTSKRSLAGVLGPLGGKNQRGYLCHNSIALTPAGEPLGLANQILHLNKRRRKKTARAVLRQCPHRQSRLWMRGREAVGDFPAGKRVVDLVDRGGDTFEFLDYEHAHDYSYVARAKSNRTALVGHQEGCEANRKVKLFDHLRCLPETGRRPQSVPPQAAKAAEGARPGRDTELAVAWAAVTLLPPAPSRARGEHRQVPLRLWAVRVWEPGPPQGAEPLEWLLLTDVAVEAVADAWERVDWYEWRWPAMEEFHKGQKTGCHVEGPQFTTKQAMEPMIGVLSVVAWLLMYLRWAVRAEATASEPAATAVPLGWVLLLSRWRTGAERPDWTVREFLLALARLGGHQNRKGDGLPGWQTLWKGWTKLHAAIRLATPPPPGSCAQR